jgi:hypothetical protein
VSFENGVFHRRHNFEFEKDFGDQDDGENVEFYFAIRKSLLPIMMFLISAQSCQATQKFVFLVQIFAEMLIAQLQFSYQLC